MKDKRSVTSQKSRGQKIDSSRKRTNPPGQNPRQDDAPDHDVHHDESRINPLSQGPVGERRGSR
jgi:hypothetical protein